MIYFFFMAEKDPQGNAIPAPPPGWVRRWVINAPSAEEARKISAQYGFGMREMQDAKQRGYPLRYSMVEIPATDQTATLLAYELVQAPVVSSAHVNGGQPVGVPQGQMHGNRQDTARDSSGFDALGDAALDGAQDNMFGPAQDGTWTDLVMGPGGGHHEVKRQ